MRHLQQIMIHSNYALKKKEIVGVIMIRKIVGMGLLAWAFVPVWAKANSENYTCYIGMQEIFNVSVIYPNEQQAILNIDQDNIGASPPFVKKGDHYELQGTEHVLGTWQPQENGQALFTINSESSKNTRFLSCKKIK